MSTQGRPFVLGLTGSIGMGKSAVARMFADLGVPVFDADAEVHRLQGPGGELLPAIEAAFPGSTGAQGVERQKLGAAVFGNPEALARLEAIVHPAVAAARAAFLATHAGAPLVVFDIPLLFEKSGWSDKSGLSDKGKSSEKDAPSEKGGSSQTGEPKKAGMAGVDAVAVVSAPARAQRQRVLARPGMTEARFEAILALQVPDADKRARADYVISTAGSLEKTRRAVAALVERLRGGRGMPAD